MIYSFPTIVIFEGCNFSDIKDNMHQCHIFLIITLLLAVEVKSYFIQVDANEEQCFFDRVTTGTKMVLFLRYNFPR